MKRLKIGFYLTTTVLAALLILHSCTQDEYLKSPIGHKQEGGIVLGKKLQNPYSVKNMKTAYENILAKETGGRTKAELDIRSTHLYVRFLPPNYDLYDILVRDTTIYFRDHPIDYEIAENGDFIMIHQFLTRFLRINIQQYQ